MSPDDMPPNISQVGKKKKKDKISHPMHPVPSQLQKAITHGSPFEVEKFGGKTRRERTILAVESEGVEQEAEKELLVVEASLFDDSSPILKMSSSVPLPPQPPPRPSRERTPSVSYTKGQISRQQAVPSSSMAATVAELVHETALQHNMQGPSVEKVEWIEIHTIEKAGDRSRRMELLVLGLTRGFQLWTVNNNGDCEEVMSERQGPIRAFLPLPNNLEAIKVETKDNFADQRPLVALVDTFSPLPDRQYCSVSVVSLLSGKVLIRLSFEEPVSALNSSSKYFIVSLSTRLVIYDIMNLRELRSIKTVQPPEGCAPSIALNGEFLAYADFKLNPDVQSCGGIGSESDETIATVASQVLSVAKAISRTMTNLGESVVGVGGVKAGDIPKGIVTIVDLNKTCDHSGTVVSHWAAHSDPLSHMTWSPDGRLLLTTDTSSCCFHIFSILSHSFSPKLGSVQHLYRLYRGNTPARVVSTAFSLDCRWLAISTNHGTCHIFAICPYGGKPTRRTHGEHFTNKESRFLRSAGLMAVSDTAQVIPQRVRTHSGPSLVTKEHPCLWNRSIARSTANPRVGPHPAPIFLNSVKKIRAQFSANNLSAWATDLAPLSLTSGARRPRFVDLPRVSLTFSSRIAADARIPSLLIARADGGVVCEYELRPRILSTMNIEDPPKLDVIPAGMWLLQRTKNNPDIPLQLQIGSPLMQWATKENTKTKPLQNEEWIPQVEICTYSGPHRRLWMGPQFKFFEYREDNNSAELMTPSESRHSLSSMKSIPVIIGGTGTSGGLDETTRIECGSWASEVSLSMTEDADISQKIADAMKEIQPDLTRQVGNNEEYFDTQSPGRERKQLKRDDEDEFLFDDF